MNENVYFGGFGCREDLEREFDVKLDSDINILFAIYEYGDYEGSATVVFERQGQLFEAHGSHCSCYGLEGQWQEEATTLDALKYMRERGTVFCYGVDAEAQGGFDSMLASQEAGVSQ